jgi:hypothetical protein
MLSNTSTDTQSPSKIGVSSASPVEGGVDVPFVRKRGRYDAGANRVHQISKVWNLSAEIIRLSVMGFKGVEIAKELNISPVTVSTALNSQVCQDHIQKLRDQRDASAVSVGMRINKMSNVALDRLHEIVNGEESKASPTLVASVAQDLLDRAGHGKIARTTNLNLTGSLSQDDLVEVYGRACEAARSCGTLIPAEDAS